MFGSNSPSELALVVLLLVIVLIAPKVPRIGEAIGAWFERSPRQEPPEKT